MKQNKINKIQFFFLANYTNIVMNIHGSHPAWAANMGPTLHMQRMNYKMD